MRIISLLVAFCFSLNVMASTGTVSALERAMDDYHYSLSVEWDQQDQNFYDVKTKEFFSKLETLIKSEGLTKEQIMSLVGKKANGQEVVNALQLKLSLLEHGSSAEDLASMVQDASKDFYAQGASWNGRVVFPVVIGLLVAAVIGYTIWFDANHECIAYGQQYRCFQTCTHSAGYFNGSYCNGYTTFCGNNTVCIEYQRK